MRHETLGHTKQRMGSSSMKSSWYASNQKAYLQNDQKAAAMREMARLNDESGGGVAYVLKLFFLTYIIMRSTSIDLAASAAASTLLLPLLPPLPWLL
jgi:hypothetical protein